MTNKMTVKIPKLLADQFDPAFLEHGKKLYEQGEYRNFDFVRNSFCAQFSDDRGEYWTIIKKKKDKDNFTFSCDCNTFIRHMKCPHITALLHIIFSKNHQPKTIYDSISQDYYSSIWLLLAKESYEAYGISEIDFSCKVDLKNKKLIISSNSDRNQSIFHFELPKTIWGKFWSKYRYVLFEDYDNKIKKLFSTEEDVTLYDHELSQTEKTDLEERMNMSGYKSWQQKFEESLWFDISKTWYLNIDVTSLKIDYNPKEKSLDISSPVCGFQFRVSKNQLATILDAIAANSALNNLIKISNNKIFLNYSLHITDSFDLKITPVLILSENKDPIFLSNTNDFDVAVFGKYIHINKHGFYQFERSISYFDSTYFNYKEIVVKNEHIPAVLKDYRKSINNRKFYNVSP